MAQVTASQVPDSASVRDYLTYALRLDLIGPRPEDTALAYEQYLTMYPAGVHAAEARALLDQHKQAGQIMNIFLGTMGTILRNQ